MSSPPATAVFNSVLCGAQSETAQHARLHSEPCGRQQQISTADYSPIATAMMRGMDAIEFLTKDHDAVKAVLITANAYDEMKAAFAEICPILQSHTYLEERFFYPRFENHDQIRQLIQEAREQHDLVKQLLDGMKHQNGQEFEKKFQTMRAEVQLHINFGKKGRFFLRSRV